MEKVSNTTVINGSKVADLTKMVVNGETYAITNYLCGELMAIKLGDNIIYNRAPIYTLWNRISGEWHPEKFFEKFYVITHSNADYITEDDCYQAYQRQAGDRVASPHMFRQSEARWLRDHGITAKVKKCVNGLIRHCYIGVKLNHPDDVNNWTMETTGVVDVVDSSTLSELADDISNAVFSLITRQLAGSDVDKEQIYRLMDRLYDMSHKVK